MVTREKIRNMEAEISIQAGMVTIQVVAMFLITSLLTVLVPRASPTPMTVPTRVWVGETGMPKPAKKKTTVSKTGTVRKGTGGK